tara:strand:+ start:121567 stop:122400 length:834 start_codon:yes stop_codon:yes gene_type:complete
MRVVVLVVDSTGPFEEYRIKFPNTSFICLDEIANDKVAERILVKYKNDLDLLRWTLKPVLLKYLLLHYSKVIYVDSDLFFFGDYNFLFGYLDDSSIILTPHWRASRLRDDRKNFYLNFEEGLYNAGFIGVNRNSMPALDFWAESCLDSCTRNSFRGQLHDQSYLNLFPIFFDKVQIVKHRGCNVANWNILECKRTLSASGTVVINDEFPIVFIHFTQSTITGIFAGNDVLLSDCLSEYIDVLKEFRGDKEIDMTKKRSLFKILNRVFESIHNFLRSL